MCFITPLEPTELHPTPFSADAIVRLYDEQGHADSIKYIFMAPKELLSLSSTSYSGSLSDGTDYGYAIIENNSSYNVSLGNYNKPTTLDTYAPKNKKLLTYPYCYLSVDPHNGNLYNFNYEDIYLTGNKYAFAIDAILTVGGSAKIYPVGYKQRSGTNYTFGFTGIKYPTCGWVSDTYTNWLTQNSVNLGFTTVNPITYGLLSGIAKTGIGIGSALMGGSLTASAGLITTGINSVYDSLQAEYKGSMQPDQVRGNENAGDINFAIGLVNPTVSQMSIKRGQAKIIDDYFSMFGYKVNRLGKPHLHVRTYYDYIKTIDVNIEGNIPEPDLNQIRKMFNNGIRFWHNTSKYLDFSVSNTIIT